jgi:hypothetical protein
MQLSEIVKAVQDVVHNSDYTSDIIKSYINEAILAVATGVEIPGRRQLSPPLPDLYIADDVETVVGAGLCELPEDYNRNVVMVVNSTGETIRHIPSFIKFMQTSADKAGGSVSKYAVNGKQLHYRDIPAAATTLTVHYYKNPEPLSADGDIPEGIPPTLHRSLIVGYAAREIFNRIELGLAGPKVDTANYDSIFQGGILKLVDLIPEDGEPDYYDNTTDYVGK